MQLDYRVLDVFTDVPLAGNQLGVFPKAAALTGEQMQSIARELNLSESIFITEKIAETAWRARIFTPGSEMPFAGHPSIGCSWHLFHESSGDMPQLELHLQGGIVRATLDSNLDPALVGITPPPVTMGAVLDDRELVAELLGITEAELGIHVGPAQLQSVGLRYLQVPLRSRETLERCRPNVELLSRMDDLHGFNQLACFTLEAYTDGAVAAVRMFAPLHGVYEDPATGSNAACLAAYLRTHGIIADTGEEWVALDQGFSIERPSKLFIRANETASGMEIAVGGQCVEVIRGVLTL